MEKGIKKAIIVPDYHSNSDTNELLLNLVRDVDPDAYIHEGSLGSEEQLLEIAENYTPQQIYENLDIKPTELDLNSMSLETPLYEINQDHLKKLQDYVEKIDPIRRADAERFQSRENWLEDVEEFREGQSSALRVIEYAKKISKGIAPNYFNFEFAKVYNNLLNDTEIRNGDDKSAAAEKAANKFEKIPSGTELVESYFNMFRESARWSKKSNRDAFVEALTDEEVMGVREKAMAESIMAVEDEQTVIANFGDAHIEGILEELPEDMVTLIYDIEGCSDGNYSDHQEAIYNPKEWLSSK